MAITVRGGATIVRNRVVDAEGKPRADAITGKDLPALAAAGILTIPQLEAAIEAGADLPISKTAATKLVKSATE